MAYPTRLSLSVHQSFERMDRVRAGWLSFCLAWKSRNALDGTLSVSPTLIASVLHVQRTIY